MEKAAACGLRSLFVGFETTNAANLKEQRKYQKPNWNAVIRAKQVSSMLPVLESILENRTQERNSDGIPRVQA